MSETTNPNFPTVVLVHGAFADASSWNGVIERLQAKGVQVTAPANPLRGIAADSAYIASRDRADRRARPRRRPLVRRRRDHATPRPTPRTSSASSTWRRSRPTRARPSARSRRARRTASSTARSCPRQYPTADGGSATEFSIDPAKAREAFAGDLSDEQAALIAATQRPVADAAFGEPNGPPAWKRLPSWAVVATGDKAAGTDVVRSMAERAGAKITEVEGSHVIMISQPQAVTDVILEAVGAVSEQLVGSASEQ